MNNENIGDNNHEEEKKSKLLKIIAAAAALLILLAAVYFYFFYQAVPQTIVNTEKPADTAEQKTGGQQLEIDKEKAVIENKITENQMDETGLKQMAASFAERFGSFSNQSNYGNISDLKIFMSAKMRNWADAYVSAEKAKAKDNLVYYGITTKAIFEEAKQFNDAGGVAEILVKTQRREMSGADAASPAYYQDVIIKLIKERGIWKVDGAEWQGK